MSTVTAPAPANFSDDELMEQIKAGDQEAFGEIHGRYSTPAFRIARMICHDSGRAEDAVQEAFVSAWRSRATYQPGRGSPHAWLMAITRHRAMDVARRHANHASRRSSEERLASVPSPTNVARDAAANAQADHLRVLLARLPETQRQVIILAFCGQLTHTEIARRLNLPAGTVKSRIRLGLTKLNDELSDSRTAKI